MISKLTRELLPPMSQSCLANVESHAILTDRLHDLDQIIEANPCDVREFLFDDTLAQYLWNVDNQGLRNAEVRFIELPQGPFTQPQ